jgi:hypothetical protein
VATREQQRRDLAELLELNPAADDELNEQHS